MLILGAKGALGPNQEGVDKRVFDIAISERKLWASRLKANAAGSSFQTRVS
jgi:hypothetical protein